MIGKMIDELIPGFAEAVPDGKEVLVLRAGDWQLSPVWDEYAGTAASALLRNWFSRPLEFKLNTIPAWQWERGTTWEQKNQVGFPVVTLYSTINLPLVFAGLYCLKPESKPLLLWHGFSSSLWVKVWFSPRKSNAMTEPTDAFKVDGENLSFPLSPTVTVATGLDIVLVPGEDAACKPTHEAEDWSPRWRLPVSKVFECVAVEFLLHIGWFHVSVEGTDVVLIVGVGVGVVLSGSATHEVEMASTALISKALSPRVYSRKAAIIASG
jgi:hypothetical protein